MRQDQNEKGDWYIAPGGRAADWKINKRYRRVGDWENFKIMECLECNETFVGDIKCTLCGSLRVTDEKLENELLEEAFVPGESDEESDDSFYPFLSYTKETL